MQHVFVLNPDHSAAMPCTSKRARKMLESGKAAVLRRHPFSIILRQEPSGRVTQPLTLKIDPGSITTGIALILEGQTGMQCIWGAELTHRGTFIRNKLIARRAIRSSRRNRTLRHRPARFQNRTRPAGWLPPSLMHRVLTIQSWASRLDRFVPLDSFSLELVSFDTQRLMNSAIQGAEYQQGTLYGSETRAYLMRKWAGACAYCQKTGKLEVEHLEPRSSGGSNRLSNLVMSCQPCNLKKGGKTLAEFLAKKPAQLARIKAQQKVSLKDAAAVNATKAKLLEILKAFGYPIETGSGAQTSFNRHQQGYEKAHWIDAACVGDSGATVKVASLSPLKIKCMGRGNRQMCGVNRFGTIIRHRTRQKVSFGFQTGDLVRAIIPDGTYAGVHVGRVTIRSRPSFRLVRFDVLPRCLTRLQRADGYGYSF
ncbi:RNA-guided endonuclease IscB (plasmid) [Deinococcus radiomollis]|uniref:RNA-guided endonuclease IscB n=1 Tax=Deinococcus radiomollis TaxID=468916 RepID=UPI0038926921